MTSRSVFRFRWSVRQLLRPRVSRRLLPSSALLIAGLVAAPFLASSPLFEGTATAGVVTLKGSVRNLDAVNPGRSFSGYWRLENGIVPVTGGGREGGVALLENGSGQHPPSPRTVTVQLAALDANPRVVVVGPGSVVEFQNDDKVAHELSTPADTSIVPLERLSPGQRRHAKFDKLGAYVVRCAEYPQIMISVLVVDSPLFSAVDEKGSFSIPLAPEGKGTLKIWSGGRWVYEAPVEVGAKELRVDLSPGRAGNGSEGKESDGASSADNKSGN